MQKKNIIPQIVFEIVFFSFSQLSRRQIQFSKQSFCHLLVYMEKYPQAKKNKKSTW